MSYCRLLVGVALLSLGCAAKVADTDPCCLTHAQIQELFAMSACIEEDDVPQCLKDTATEPPEPGIDPNRAEKYLFIKDRTVGISKEAKKTGKGEIVIDLRMVEKATTKIELIFRNNKEKTQYKQKDIKSFRKAIDEGDVMILLMKPTKKSCELTRITVIRPGPKKKGG